MTRTVFTEHKHVGSRLRNDSPIGKSAKDISNEFTKKKKTPIGEMDVLKIPNLKDRPELKRCEHRAGRGREEAPHRGCGRAPSPPTGLSGASDTHGPVVPAAATRSRACADAACRGVCRSTVCGDPALARAGSRDAASSHSRTELQLVVGADVAPPTPQETSGWHVRKHKPNLRLEGRFHTVVQFYLKRLLGALSNTGDEHSGAPAPATFLRWFSARCRGHAGTRNQDPEAGRRKARSCRAMPHRELRTPLADSLWGGASELGDFRCPTVSTGPRSLISFGGAPLNWGTSDWTDKVFGRRRDHRDATCLSRRHKQRNLKHKHQDPKAHNH